MKWKIIHPWACNQIRKISGCACVGNAGNVFLSHRLRKPLVNDPGMHNGTCVTHVPRCMSGSLTRDGRENVPGIPGACTNCNFTYLTKGYCKNTTKRGNGRWMCRAGNNRLFIRDIRLRHVEEQLTHWGRDKMAAILQTTSSSAFSLIQIYELRLKFHCGLFLEVPLTIFQLWFR